MTDPAHLLIKPDGTPVHILDVNNNPVPISALWSRHTAIIIFVRHFLCIDCQDYFKAVWDAYTAHFTTSSLVASPQFNIIGCGSTRLAQSLAIDVGAYAHPHFHIYTDQDRSAYKALGLVHKNQFDCWRCVRGTQLALWQGATRCWCICDAGDVKQNGGEYVMEGGTGRCLLAHVDQTPGGHAKVDDILKAAGMIKGV